MRRNRSYILYEVDKLNHVDRRIAKDKTKKSK